MPDRASFLSVGVQNWRGEKSLVHRFLAGLKECSRARDVSSGMKIHSEIIENSLQGNRFLANNLVFMYAKCGSMENARRVFDAMPERDIISWTSLIVGYSESGDHALALELFETMLQSGSCKPDARAFVGALAACTALVMSRDHQLRGDEFELEKDRRLQVLRRGIEIHSGARAAGCCDFILSSKFVDFYSKCGRMDLARDVFDSLSRPNIVCWTSLLHGYVDSGKSEVAVRLFQEQAQLQCSHLDPHIFVAVISACGRAGEAGAAGDWIETGKRIHSQAELHRCCNLFVETTLISMYSSLGCMPLARRVFDRMHRPPPVAAWNALLQGYSRNGEHQLPLELFEACHECDAVTLSTAAAACAVLAAKPGADHQTLVNRVDGIRRRTAPVRCCDEFVDAAVLSTYAHCGRMQLARAVFDGMPRREGAAWSALIRGYVRSGDVERAVQAAGECMSTAVYRSDHRAVAAVLSACGAAADVARGRAVHAEVCRRGLGEERAVVVALAEMYAGCGEAEAARRVAEGSEGRSLLLWTAVMSGYSRAGEVAEVAEVAAMMREEGVVVDEVAVLWAAGACGRRGDVEGLAAVLRGGAGVKVWASVADGLARAGRVAEAAEVVREMGSGADSVMWKGVLSAAADRGDTKVGREVFGEVIKLEPADASAYVLLSNLCEFKT